MARLPGDPPAHGGGRGSLPVLIGVAQDESRGADRLRQPCGGKVPCSAGKKKSWGLDSFQIFPNFAIVFWETGWYLTYHYWPVAYNRLLFEANAYFAKPRNVRERLAQQLGIATIKEYALEDCGTLEATQMGLESRAVTTFPLGDQEFMCRHANRMINNWVEDYQRKQAEG